MKITSPDIVLFGDSLCTSFYVSKVPETMLRARRSANKGGWPELTGLNINPYTSVSAYLDPCPPSIRLRSKLVLGAKSIHQKIKFFVKENNVHPRVYLTALGHNNLDWKADILKRKMTFAKFLKVYPQEIAEKTIESQKLIIRKMPRPNSDLPQKILISGLVNFEEFFVIRKKRVVEVGIQYSGLAEDIFESLRPEYQKNLLKLRNQINEKLEEEVKRQREFFKSYNYDLQYVDFYQNLPLIDPKILHESDSWHLSEHGHRYFADNLGPKLKSYLL